MALSTGSGGTGRYNLYFKIKLISFTKLIIIAFIFRIQYKIKPHFHHCVVNNNRI